MGGATAQQRRLTVKETAGAGEAAENARLKERVGCARMQRHATVETAGTALA